MNRQGLSFITLIVISVSMLGFPNIQAQNVQDYVMCFDYSTSTLQPIGIGDTVFQYTDRIGIWVQIQNPADVTYRVVWEDPNGSQFRNVAVNVIDKSDSDWGIVFDAINIAESTANNKLGVWSVKLFIDGEVEVEAQFQIINYDDLIESISDIQKQIIDIIDEKDALAAQNAALEASLEALQADYSALQTQVGTSSDYEELLDEYEALSEDYDALQASQGSTRTMMYAAIVVALVAVVVAVYFGLLKK